MLIYIRHICSVVQIRIFFQLADGYDGYIIHKLCPTSLSISIFGNVLISELKRSFLFVKIEMLVHMASKIVALLVWLAGTTTNRGIDDV